MDKCKEVEIPLTQGENMSKECESDIIHGIQY